MYSTFYLNNHGKTKTSIDTTGFNFEQHSEFIKSRERFLNILSSERLTEEGKRLKNAAECFTACEVVGSRASDNARRKDYIAFDLDNIPFPFSEFKEYLLKNLSQYSFFAYTTFSHTEAVPKLRLLIPLDKPCDLKTVLDHKTIHEKTAKDLGIDKFVDEVTNDKARLYYVPCSFIDLKCEYIENFAGDKYSTERYLSFAPPAAPQIEFPPTAPNAPTAPTASAPSSVSTAPTAATVGRCPSEKRIFNELFPDVRSVLDRLTDDFRKESESRYLSLKSESKSAGIAIYESGRFAYSFHGHSPLSTGHRLTSFDIIESLFLSLNDAKREYKTKDRPSFRSAINYACTLFPEFKERYAQTQTRKFSYNIFSDFIEDNDINIYHDVIKRRSVISSAAFCSGMSDDAKAIKITELIKDAGYKTNLNEICSFINLYANEHQRNIIIELIDAAEADDYDYLSDFHRMTGNTDAFEQRLFKKWIWQALSLLENEIEKGLPTCGLLLFTGEKGVGKSFICKRLALMDQYSHSGFLNLLNTDSLKENLCAFVTELNEINSTLKRTDFNLMKSFLTACQDTFRLPYDRFEQTQPRRTSFCGSVNPEDADSLFAEKDRRYWFYHIPKKINPEEIKDFPFLLLFRQVRKEQRKDILAYRLTDEEEREVIQLSREHLKREAGEEEFLTLLTRNRTVSEDSWGNSEEIVSAWVRQGDFVLDMGKDLKISSTALGRLCTKNDIPAIRTKTNRLKLLVCKRSDLNKYTSYETADMTRMRAIADRLRKDRIVPTQERIDEEKKASKDAADSFLDDFAAEAEETEKPFDVAEENSGENTAESAETLLFDFGTERDEAERIRTEIYTQLMKMKGSSNEAIALSYAGNYKKTDDINELKTLLKRVELASKLH